MCVDRCPVCYDEGLEDFVVLQPSIPRSGDLKFAECKICPIPGLFFQIYKRMKRRQRIETRRQRIQFFAKEIVVGNPYAEKSACALAANGAGAGAGAGDDAGVVGAFAGLQL